MFKNLIGLIHGQDEDQPFKIKTTGLETKIKISWVWPRPSTGLKTWTSSVKVTTYKLGLRLLYSNTLFH